MTGELPRWLDFQALRFHSQGLIERSSFLHCFGASKHPIGGSEQTFGFSSTVFRANPQLGALKVLIRILTEVNMQVVVFFFEFLFFLRRELPTPQLAAAMMKRKHMQNESGLRELFGSVCPGWMLGEKCVTTNKERRRRDVTMGTMHNDMFTSHTPIG